MCLPSCYAWLNYICLHHLLVSRFGKFVTCHPPLPPDVMLYGRLPSCFLPLEHSSNIICFFQVKYLSIRVTIIAVITAQQACSFGLFIFFALSSLSQYIRLLPYHYFDGGASLLCNLHLSDGWPFILLAGSIFPGEEKQHSVCIEDKNV